MLALSRLPLRGQRRTADGVASGHRLPVSIRRIVSPDHLERG